MNAITLEDAQTRLAEVIESLTLGEAVVITRDDTPIARLVAAGSTTRAPRKAGSAKGQLVILAEDDDHQAAFAEYTGSFSAVHTVNAPSGPA